MKKCIYLFLLISSLCAAQGTTLKMTTTYPENKEIDQLFRFQGIEMYHTKISGTDLKSKKYYIVSKEIWKGKVKSVDTLFNSATFPVSVVEGDTLKFNVIAMKSGSKTLKVMFDFGRFSLIEEYKSTKHSDYSLRDFGAQIEIETGKPFYAFAYILPQRNKDGSSSWCAVQYSGKDIENWGTEFGIEHYILFEMKFSDQESLFTTALSKN
ncbi:hypothetical protein FMM05_03770 [Flavobacterium zepuense]|uniref:Uncharacterized protein n=1 Tax=Flavobacterium zepuense TaxID=2593302 RepID=A0A552V7R1_9FLAO|nr:hypothetical protein [Flavobacterium zepuense]TRW26506.1 hypothetical protein FMM05_03770 [Flavobacterium zepuense]